MKKIAFVDRDGTLIEEPSDHQIDSVAKFRLLPDVIPALLRLRDAGFSFVMVTNQDGLGSAQYPQESFDLVQKLLLDVLETQGVRFEKTLICPHREEDRCLCRKPGLGLVTGYLADPALDRQRSVVIGDRPTDLELARNMGLPGLRIGESLGWRAIADQLVNAPRRGECLRETRETKISVAVNLDQADGTRISTGLGFFDHMLEQIVRHGGFSATIDVKGDLEVDDHHTVEDTALALGSAIRQALGDKAGIGRFGFHLPMDDASAQVAIDLSGRAYCKFEGSFDRETVGGLATEMVPHFFRSFADGLGANIHIKVEGQNTHHRIESAFKAVGRSLRAAIALTGGHGIPSSKGTL